MKNETIKKFKNLNNLIGNTPIIKINYKIKNNNYSTYVKLEWYNLTGSIKDRVAYNILKNAYEKNIINEETEIVETTSGNMGISLSAIGTYLGNKVTIFMPDYMSTERINILKNFGTNVKLISKDNGGFLGCLKESQIYTKTHKNTFLTLQFDNKINTLTHYNSTANEIINSLKNKKIFAFTSGVGTGGTLIGIGKKLKEKNSNTKIIALEPKSSPVLKTGKKCGDHEISGISDEFIPGLYNKSLVDEIIDISNEDAIYMAQQLSKKLGLNVGISSGANLVSSAIINYKYNNINSKFGEIITIFADDNKKYLSTNLSNVVDNNSLDFTKNITLIDFEVII